MHQEIIIKCRNKDNSKNERNDRTGKERKGLKEGRKEVRNQDGRSKEARTKGRKGGSKKGRMEGKPFVKQRNTNHFLQRPAANQASKAVSAAETSRSVSLLKGSGYWYPFAQKRHKQLSLQLVRLFLFCGTLQVSLHATLQGINMNANSYSNFWCVWGRVDGLPCPRFFATRTIPCRWWNLGRWWATLFNLLVPHSCTLRVSLGLYRSCGWLGQAPELWITPTYSSCCWGYHLSWFKTYDHARPKGRIYRIVPKGGQGVFTDSD